MVRSLDSLPNPKVATELESPDWIVADLGSRTVDAGVLESFKKAHPEAQLFLVAGDPNAPVPKELARLGVRHWFLRPLDQSELRRVLSAALRTRRAELVRQRVRGIEFPTFDELIGEDPGFRAACDLARRAAASPSTVVLIEGETGTGKGMFAKAIHRESPRSAGPFVEVNCASLPGGLLESELFGHEKGAFTHAQSAKPGLLELADSGTFFLDEVAETDIQVQAKILKFLDSGRYRRVGGVEERDVDVRVIAATQRNLQAEAEAGTFRADLFHRLHVVRVRIPPIRERLVDLRPLLTHYLRRFAVSNARPSLHWSDEALSLLARHQWPGNVREIVNLCERVVLLNRDNEEICAADLPELVTTERVVRGRREGHSLQLDIPEGVGFEELERAILKATLERAMGNVSAAAAALQMGRGQLRYRMDRLGLGGTDSPQPASRRAAEPRRPGPA